MGSRWKPSCGAPPFEKQFLKAVASVGKHLVSTYCVPGTAEGPGDPSGDKNRDGPSPCGQYVLTEGLLQICSNQHLGLNECMSMSE